jgi:catechol 2,3-dioxygenase
MSQTSDNSSIIRPTLHHFGVTTSHLGRMVEWYSKVLGMVTIYSTSNASESEAGMSPGLTFVSNDKANHRLAMISLPELKDDAEKKGMRNSSMWPSSMPRSTIC